MNAVDFLKGNPDRRLYEVTVALGGELLASGGLADDDADGRKKIEAAFASGRAAEIFGRMVAALGGPADFMEKPEKHLKAAPLVRPVMADARRHGHRDRHPRHRHRRGGARRRPHEAPRIRSTIRSASRAWPASAPRSAPTRRWPSSMPATRPPRPRPKRRSGGPMPSARRPPPPDRPFTSASARDRRDARLTPGTDTIKLDSTEALRPTPLARYVRLRDGPSGGSHGERAQRGP